MQHRVGGLEKANITGDVCYLPKNHEEMIHIRASKVAGIADDIPLLEVEGPEDAELLVLSWGSTYGAVISAIARAHEQGKSVACAHLRYLNPMPRNTEEVVRSYKKVLIPEMNCGQLLFCIRSRFLVDAVGFNKVEGKPFKISEIERKIDEMLEGR